MTETPPRYRCGFARHDVDYRPRATCGIRFGGWFYWPSETPLGESTGPFETLEMCISHLLECDYVVERIIEPPSDRARAERATAMRLEPTITD